MHYRQSATERLSLESTYKPNNTDQSITLSTVTSHRVIWSLSRIHKAYWCGLEFTLFSDVVCNSHSLVGLSRIHIVQWGYQIFTLFSGLVWSLCCGVKDRVGVWSEDKW